MRKVWLWSVAILSATALFASAAFVATVAAWRAAQSPPFEVQQDIAYGPLERQVLDLYLPNDDGKGLRPAVVVIHGGGWRSGNKQQLRLLAERFAARGYVATAINYRLAPQWHYPAQLDDCQRAVRWLRKQAAKWRIDPKRIGAADNRPTGQDNAIEAPNDS